MYKHILKCFVALAILCGAMMVITLVGARQPVHASKADLSEEIQKNLSEAVKPTKQPRALNLPDSVEFTPSDEAQLEECKNFTRQLPVSQAASRIMGIVALQKVMSSKLSNFLCQPIVLDVFGYEKLLVVESDDLSKTLLCETLNDAMLNNRAVLVFYDTVGGSYDSIRQIHILRNDPCSKVAHLYKRSSTTEPQPFPHEIPHGDY